MDAVRRPPRWLRIGLLLGVPLAAAVPATFAVGAHLQQGCTAVGLALAARFLGMGLLLAGAAGAGWWASGGVRAGHGCLAGLVMGLVVAAGLVAAPLMGMVPQEGCGTPPSAYLQPQQVTSIVVQSAVWFVVEVTLLAGIYAVLAAWVRRGVIGRRGRRGGSAPTSTDEAT